MPSLREQTESQFAKLRQNKPEFASQVDVILTSAEMVEKGSHAIALGQQAPQFTLPNAGGEVVSLTQLLDSGPVVVTFYRGSWCPYCNLQLRAMQSRLTDIHALNAKLVAISPQMPDASLSQDERETLAFPVLSDQDARVATEYGVAWEVPEIFLEHMRKDRNLELAEINGGSGSVLPIPATFVLNRDRVVTWRFVNVDYRLRAEPDDILAALQKLS